MMPTHLRKSKTENNTDVNKGFTRVLLLLIHPIRRSCLRRACPLCESAKENVVEKHFVSES